MRREIAEKEFQLRLLLDLQKQDERHRSEVEMPYLENDALNKQLAAIEAEREELKRKADEAAALTWKRFQNREPSYAVAVGTGIK